MFFHFVMIPAIIFTLIIINSSGLSITDITIKLFFYHLIFYPLSGFCAGFSPADTFYLSRWEHEITLPIGYAFSVRQSRSIWKKFPAVFTRTPAEAFEGWLKTYRIPQCPVPANTTNNMVSAVPNPVATKTMLTSLLGNRAKADFSSRPYALPVVVF